MTGLRERKKRQARDRIVEEAGRLFADRGFAATTIEGIATASDVSPGTVYNYFGTKNTLLLAHLENRVAVMMSAGSKLVADPPGDVDAALIGLLDIYVEGMTAIDRELLREVLAAGFTQSSDGLSEPARLDELLMSQLAHLIDTLRPALRPGIQPEDAVALLYSILGTQLIMYASVDSISPAALRRSTVRQIRLACAGMCVPEETEE